MHDIVVIGGSMGSFQVVKNLLAALPSDFPAAVFVVIHIPHDNGELLSQSMQHTTALPVATAVEGAPIGYGHIIMAPADHHLMLFNGKVRLGRGPRENMSRPAIDALFRSAAVGQGPKVIGILLSGYLNDGAAGVAAIKQCGGVTIVQNPADSQVPDMPLNAFRTSDIDYRVDAAQLPALLCDLVQKPAKAAPPVPARLELEIEIALGLPCNAAVIEKIADPSAISCPGCGGVLSAIRATPPLRYRCQVGHAYTADCLDAEQEVASDEAMRVALRIVEERVTLLKRMAADDEDSGRLKSSVKWKEKAAEYELSAEVIRRSFQKIRAA